jgi:hypothetical protein
MVAMTATTYYLVLGSEIWYPWYSVLLQSRLALSRAFGRLVTSHLNVEATCITKAANEICINKAVEGYCVTKAGHCLGGNPLIPFHYAMCRKGHLRK